MMAESAPQAIYWHRDLPPLDAEPIGEHTIEATSGRVPGTIAHRDELWTRCEDDLMSQTRHRLTEEMARLGSATAAFAGCTTATAQFLDASSWRTRSVVTSPFEDGPEPSLSL